mgnify:CR=1 FL=1
MGILERYTKAMASGNIDACIQIEQEYDLFGYPPEIVSVGLAAVDKGLDHLQAVDDYLDA